MRTKTTMGKVIVLLMVMVATRVLAYSPSSTTICRTSWLSMIKAPSARSAEPSSTSLSSSLRSSSGCRRSFMTSVQHSYHPTSWATTRHLSRPRRSRYSRSSTASTLPATAGSSSGESNKNPDTEKMVKKLVSSLLNIINKWILDPVRSFIKALIKVFHNLKKEKKEEKEEKVPKTAAQNHASLLKDLGNRLEMVSDESIVNGDTVPSVSPHVVGSVVTKTQVTATLEPETQVEPQVAATATAVAVPPNETDQETSGKRATSASNVDLTGKWTMMVTDEFKKEYDEYLTQLGQPLLVRSVALSIVGMTTEETKQSRQGKELLIRGRNARGLWERTLVTQDADGQPTTQEIITADSEVVTAESWWEKAGRVHKSWLRGGSKYGGGDFESSRYLENNGSVLVCESIFHPKDTTRDQARVTWRFRRDGA